MCQADVTDSCRITQVQTIQISAFIILFCYFDNHEKQGVILWKLEVFHYMFVVC